MINWLPKPFTEGIRVSIINDKSPSIVKESGFTSINIPDESFLSDVAEWIVAKNKKLFFHGALTKIGKKLILISGESESGKSTLCARIQSLGGEVYCDDTFLIDSYGEIIPIAKPPHFRGKAKNNQITLTSINKLNSSYITHVLFPKFGESSSLISISEAATLKSFLKSGGLRKVGELSKDLCKPLVPGIIKVLGQIARNSSNFLVLYNDEDLIRPLDSLISLEPL